MGRFINTKDIKGRDVYCYMCPELTDTIKMYGETDRRVKEFLSSDEFRSKLYFYFADKNPPAVLFLGNLPSVDYCAMCVFPDM